MGKSTIVFTFIKNVCLMYALRHINILEKFLWGIKKAAKTVIHLFNFL